MHNPYEEYYLNQAKGNDSYQLGGSLSGFRGARLQRGSGLGSLFKGFVRTALPFAKTGAKLLGKSLLSTGANILKDVANGEGFKQSLKKRGKQGGKKFLSSLNNQMGRGTKRKRVSDKTAPQKNKRKKTLPHPKSIKGPIVTRPSPVYNDIFT